MRRERIAILVCIFLTSINLLAWTIIFDFCQPPLLKIVFFDVGQGDAIFIETASLYQILIDGGPDQQILDKLSNQMPFWDRSIDLLILTHPEKDHIAGLIEVLKRYQVDNILWTGVKHRTGIVEEWQKLLDEQKDTKIRIAKSGERIIAGNIILKTLYPFESLEGKKIKNTNSTSIVSKLYFGNNSFLFTGDISKKEEGQIIDKARKSLDSDVLKIAHHGSKTSTSQEFLESVTPEIAIISVGKDNSYGHPHKDVLERLKNFGVQIFRTDQDGDIEIISNGQYIFIKK